MHLLSTWRRDCHVVLRVDWEASLPLIPKATMFEIFLKQKDAKRSKESLSYHVSDWLLYAVGGPKLTVLAGLLYYLSRVSYFVPVPGPWSRAVKWLRGGLTN